MTIALLCLLESLPAWAQSIGGKQQPLDLDIRKASRLLLEQIPPEYPALAKVNYIQGKVRVQLVVSDTGSVEEAHVLSGNPLLAAAVLDSVHGWRYAPLVVGGAAVAFATKVEINFSLHLRNMDLSPKQAESDFHRQVKPPEVLVGQETNPATDPSVRLRLLVNAKGKVIDAEILEGIPSKLDRARKNLERWVFRPARWGALFVPWYLDVDVPVDDPPPSQGGARRMADENAPST